MRYLLLSEFEQPRETLFTVPDKHRSRTSDVMLYLIERTDAKEVTLSSLTHRLGDRTFGILLLLMAVFNLIPIISILSGLLVAILGLQLALGFQEAKLPNFVLTKRLPAKQVRAALNVFLPKIKSLERYIKPRWHFTEAAIFDRINGVILMLVGLMILLPIPLANVIPAFVVFLMGLGLLERDGLLQMLALCLSFLTGVLIYLFVF